jgi:integrase
MAKQRKNGEGYDTVRLKDGNYSKRITVGRDQSTGKQKRITVTGKTQAEVRSKAQKARLEAEQGIYKDPSKITVKEWLLKWLEVYAKPAVKLSTFISYEGYINNHLIPAFGGMQLFSLRADTIQGFYNGKMENGRRDKALNEKTGELEIKAGGLSAKTIRNLHNMLHKAFGQAYKNGLVLTNVIDLVAPPRAVKAEMRVLTLLEQRTLLEQTKEHRLGIVVILGLGTGMRIGEMLALKWKDIDFNKNLLQVRHTINRLKSYEGDAKTEIVLGEPKTEKSRRTIPLDDILIERLKEHKKNQLSERLKAGKAYVNQDFLFTNELGAPVEPRTYQDIFQKLVKQAGISNVNIHALRHTFATRALEAGIPAKIVSEILGHSTVAITLDLYSHVSVDTKREAIEKMANLYR